jgi:hypothetical protein
MTTESIHSYFDQQMIVTHNHDVIFKLREPGVKYGETLPILTCSLSQLMDGIAFLFLGKINGEDFKRMLTRNPMNASFCYKCGHARISAIEHMKSFCDAPECIRKPIHDTH